MVLSSSGVTLASKFCFQASKRKQSANAVGVYSVDFPALNDVKGAFDISSTNDISAACDKFQKLAPSKQGGGGQIQGVYHCESNNSQANSDTGGNTSTSGTTGGGKGNSAAGVAINAAMLGLAVVGGLVALL